MKIIFAQGNPGSKFQMTRHNVAFAVVDKLAGDAPFKSNAKFSADVAETVVAGEKVTLVKPATFYNETGRSFIAVKQFYKVSSEDILVIHDELALPFGTIRTRVGGSDAGNNGIKSINANGGDTTNRLRIGVGNELRARMGDVDFVLSRFSKDEETLLEKAVIPKCLGMIHDFISGNHTPTSHTLIDSPE